MNIQIVVYVVCIFLRTTSQPLLRIMTSHAKITSRLVVLGLWQERKCPDSVGRHVQYPLGRVERREAELPAPEGAVGHLEYVADEHDGEQEL